MNACQLRFVDRTGSTNDDASGLARSGAPHGTAVAARLQTAGRGRRGHVWSSPEGGLYLSVVLRPSVPMRHFIGIPIVCSLGVLDALRAWGVPAALKWPNDVLLGRGKLGGVLVEAGSSGEGPFAVFGIGVNVRRAGADAIGSGGRVADSPAPLHPSFLEEIRPFDDCEVAALAEDMRREVVSAVDGWSLAVAQGRAVAGPLAPVLDRYYDAVPALGHQVRVLTPAGRDLGAGMFSGVDGWGRATVRFADGREVEFAAEQASLRPVAD